MCCNNIQLVTKETTCDIICPNCTSSKHTYWHHHVGHMGSLADDTVAIMWDTELIFGTHKGPCPLPRVNNKQSPKPPGLMIGASASCCSFWLSFFDCSLTSLSKVTSCCRDEISLTQQCHSRWLYLFNQQPLYLNFVRHVKVIEATLPWQLLDDIRPKQVKTNEQERCEALLVSNINKVWNKLGSFYWPWNSCCDHSIFIKLVLLREWYWFLPVRVFLCKY